MHADWIEIVWTSITGFGLVTVTINLINARRSLRLLNGDRSMRIIAHSLVRREAVRVAIQLLLTTVGVIAMFKVPAPNHDPSGRLVMVAIFIAFALLNNLNSELDRQVRNKLRRDQ